MKLRILPVLAALAGAALMPTVVPAESEMDEIQVLRAQVNADRQAVVALNMELSEKQAEGFWPLYRKYQQDREELVDKRVKLLIEFRDNQIGMKAETAKQILDDALKLEKQINDLKRKYVSDFEKVLGPRHTLRYYQIESKLDTIINYELASVVPLQQ